MPASPRKPSKGKAKTPAQKIGCPFCGEMISKRAKKCPACRSAITAASRKTPTPKAEAAIVEAVAQPTEKEAEVAADEPKLPPAVEGRELTTKTENVQETVNISSGTQAESQTPASSDPSSREREAVLSELIVAEKAASSEPVQPGDPSTIPAANAKPDDGGVPVILVLEPESKDAHSEVEPIPVDQIMVRDVASEASPVKMPPDVGAMLANLLPANSYEYMLPAASSIADDGDGLGAQAALSGSLVAEQPKAVSLDSAIMVEPASPTDITPLQESPEPVPPIEPVISSVGEEKKSSKPIRKRKLKTAKAAPSPAPASTNEAPPQPAVPQLDMAVKPIVGTTQACQDIPKNT